MTIWMGIEIWMDINLAIVAFLIPAKRTGEVIPFPRRYKRRRLE